MKKTNPAPNGGPHRKGLYLFLLIFNTIAFFTLYQLLLQYAAATDRTFASFVVMIVYSALLLGFVLAYLIYNRFLYRKGLTPEQLSPDWSEEQKAAFLEDGNRRLEKSKWMILIIFPLIFTFFFDAINLFILDPMR